MNNPQVWTSERRGSSLIADSVKELPMDDAGHEAVKAAPPQRAEETLRFLGEASRLLSASLDYAATLTQLANLVVPALADWCIVHLVNKDQSIRWVAVAHGDSTKEEIARELEQRYPRDASGTSGVLGVLRTGQSVLYPEVADTQIELRAATAEHLQLLRVMGTRSAMIVPLVARGRTLGAISFLSSRRERRYGPADLQLAEELASRAALAVDNARLYNEAQAVVRMRDQMLSAITHDLVQPLASIKASAELLLDQGADPDGSEVAWLAGRINIAATKMTAMLRELLDLGRMQVGLPLQLQRHLTDLVTLARQQVEAYQKTTENHHIRVETTVAELVGKWDVLRLERVIGNLLANAIKYSPNGGEIIVTLSAEQDAQGAWGKLSVRDRGVGIPADDLPHIFEWFHRGANVKDHIAGTGIGLAGARQIVEQHGGSTSVTSEEGRGSTFTIRLPLR